MKLTLDQDSATEFRMTPAFSVVYAQILHLLEIVLDNSFSVEDLMGSCEIKLVENSSSKMVYRGYLCLDALRKTSFQRVEFCVIYHWDRYCRRFKDSSNPPTDAMVMIGWDGTTNISPRLKKKGFGCRLFRSYFGSELEDAVLQPKNWVKPYLWGGQVPTFLVSDELVKSLIQTGASACVGTVGDDVVLVDME